MARRASFNLSVGEIIGTSFSVWFRNLIPFSMLSAIAMAPWVVVMLMAIDQGDENTMVVMLLVATLLGMLLMYVLTGAVTFGVVQQLRQKPTGFADVLNQGMKRLLPVLGTAFLAGLRILLFTLLLVIPGIIEFMRLYVAVPAAVMEGKSGGAAIERSIKLTNGSRWPIFGAVVVLWILQNIVERVSAVLLAAADPMVGVWSSIGIAIVLAPLSSCAIAVTYYLLRSGKEQVAPQEIAAVFD